MARVSLTALLLLAGCVYLAQSQSLNLDVSGGVFNGARIDPNSDGKALGAAVDLLASKLNATVSGLANTLKPALQAAGSLKAGALQSVLGLFGVPLQDAAGSVINALSAVRDASETTLSSFFGLLLDNTKELRDTLQDGNAVIDIVRTLRGAKCEAAKFTPPTTKPAALSGPAGSLKFTTGSCSLKRTADPLRLDYTLDCVQPGVAFSAQVPRYTSRFITGAKATTEVCKVTRKYGVESETVITLFNLADFIASLESNATSADGASAGAGAAAGAAGAGAGAGAAGGQGGLAGLLGVNAGAGWFNTLFPVASKLNGRRVQFMPKNVRDAVQKAIQQSTVDISFEYKPFNLKQDLLKQASNVADALSQTFEVNQKLFKVYQDDLASWADPNNPDVQNLNFNQNLREAMSKYNVSNIFDGAFTKTASALMSKTKLGQQVASKLPGGGLLETLTTEKPLRTLLSKAREGAGQPVTLKLETGLDEAVGQALEALKQAAPGADALSKLLSAPKKGSLLASLMKHKGANGQLKELEKIFGGFGDLASQLGNLRAAAAGAGAKAAAGAGAKAAAAADASSP